MKNKFKRNLVFMVVIATSIGGYIYNNQSSANVSSLLLENVEALADEEYEHVSCFGTGSVDCPLNNTKVYFVKYPYGLHY